MAQSVEAENKNDLNYDADKLRCKIFSMLESNWLLGFRDNKVWIPQVLQELVAEPTPRGKICILSIDGGGGMRGGIIAARVLLFLEDALQRKSGNPAASIADYFDVAAGTSIGGILTSMLFTDGGTGHPLFAAEDAWKVLLEKGKQIFSPKPTGGALGAMARLLGLRAAQRSSSSSTKTLEQLLKKWLVKDDGKCLTLKDTLKAVLIPCYDLCSRAPFLFSRADALESDNYDFNMWEVCRATAATPGFFTPISMASVDGHTACIALDGGLVMNNPAAAAITHVLHNKQEFPLVKGVDDMLVLSLGTGHSHPNPSADLTDWESGLKPLMNIVLHGVSDNVDNLITMAFSNDIRHNYVRVQETGVANKSVETGESSSVVRAAESMLKEKGMEAVPFGGKRMLSESNAQRLEWFAEQLILEQHARATRKMPTVRLKRTCTSPSNEGDSNSRL